ncbi:MAG: macro domain-containing protein [Gammaproteobacteria bacterium]
MNSINIASVTIECLQGDITRQSDVDRVVNAANAQLMPGGGVAGAIHNRAGPGLAAECDPLAPIRPGEAVITAAHLLPNKHIIHCLGPIYGIDQPEDDLLAACFRNALNLAEANGLRSIAFPAISTGAFGYPLEPAAHVSLGAIRDYIVPERKLVQNLELVRFVLWNPADLQVFSEAMQLVFTEPG